MVKDKRRTSGKYIRLGVIDAKEEKKW